jgi:hypothetical protein
MISPGQFTSWLSSLPPRPSSVFDDREGCPVCSGPRGTCVTDDDQEERVDKAAWIRAFVAERAKLQTRGPRKVPAR